MASHSTSFIKRAKLKGMGHEAECNVSGSLKSLPGSNIPPEPTKLDISGEPSNLPDGLYEVSFDGHTKSFRRKDGFWIAP